MRPQHLRFSLARSGDYGSKCVVSQDNHKCHPNPPTLSPQQMHFRAMHQGAIQDPQHTAMLLKSVYWEVCLHPRLMAHHLCLFLSIDSVHLLDTHINEVHHVQGQGRHPASCLRCRVPDKG